MWAVPFCGWESGRRVVRVRSGVVIFHVTVHAIGRQACVHTARMARRTVESCVDPYQRKRVIEGRTGPRRRLVACLTARRKSSRGVVGIGRRVVVIEVAIDTFGRESGVHGPRVTGAALLGDVRADQRPHRMRVGGLEPVRIRLLMAGVARGRESGRRVVRVCSGVVVIQVAVHAIRRQACVHTARMAGRTVESCMDPYQRIGVDEATRGLVVPPGRFVALLAIGWETSTAMVGIIGGLVVFEVASNAIGGCSNVYAIRVARRAIQRRVHTDQLVGVCEVGAGPRRRLMEIGRAHV